MKTAEIQQLAEDALHDLKAIDLEIYDVKKLTTITDAMIICTGRSIRHVKSLAENVVIKAKEKKHNYIKMEGEQTGEWVIVDLADVVIHIMLADTRKYYHLEDLWQPVQKSREKNADSYLNSRE